MKQKITTNVILLAVALCSVVLLPGCEGMALEAKNKRMIAAHNAGQISNAEFKNWQKSYAYLSDKYNLEMQLGIKPSEQVYRYWVSTGRNTEATRRYIVSRNPALAPLIESLRPPPPYEPVIGQEVITLGPQPREKKPPGGGGPPPGGGGPGGPSGGAPPR